MRILLTNNTLSYRAGSELYCRDLAIALKIRGHEVGAFSTLIGDVAAEMIVAGVEVVSNLSQLSFIPDVIHGQHHLESMMAMSHFSTTPAIFVCHGWIPWEEIPPKFSSILKYIAVDDLCQRRVIETLGIEAKEVEVIRNFIDLDRFPLRSELPSRPKRALVLSNAATNSNFGALIKEACQRLQIDSVDFAGIGSKNSIETEKFLANYDLVFCKARAAIESIGSGCAVVVVDHAGLFGMADLENYEYLRQFNFGYQTLQKQEITIENLVVEIDKYDPIDARQLSLKMRNDGDMQRVILQFEKIYQDLHGKVINVSEQARDISKYLEFLALRIKGNDDNLNLLQKINILEDQNLKLKVDLSVIEGSRGFKILSIYWKVHIWLRAMKSKFAKL
jgi:hypothetical protein